MPEFTTNSFPLDGNRAILAPFWADVDTSKNGNVWYHLTVDSDLLRRATEEIANAFPDAEGDFIISSLLIVTWDHVGYYGSTTDKVYIIHVHVLCLIYSAYTVNNTSYYDHSIML